MADEASMNEMLRQLMEAAGASAGEGGRREPVRPYTCAEDVTFLDALNSVDCDGSDRCAFSVKDFGCTMITKDVFTVPCDAECTFVLVQQRGEPVIAFGVLDAASGAYGNNSLGSNELAGSVGFIGRGNQFALAHQEDISQQAEMRLMPGNTITVKVEQHALSFFVDGRRVFGGFALPDGKYRFGVSLSAQGQVVYVGSKAKLEADAGLAEFIRSKASATAPEQDPPIPDRKYTGEGCIRFVDNLVGIECCGEDKVAVATNDKRRTLVTQQSVLGALSSSCSYVVAARPTKTTGRSLYAIGIVDVNPVHFGSNILGCNINNSIALICDGQHSNIVLADKVFDGPFPPLKVGDVVKFIMENQHARIDVNGTSVSPKLGNLTFNGKFRYACALTERGMACVLGDEMTEEAKKFILSHVPEATVADPPSGAPVAKKPTRPKLPLKDRWYNELDRWHMAPTEKDAVKITDIARATSVQLLPDNEPSVAVSEEVFEVFAFSSVGCDGCHRIPLYQNRRKCRKCADADLCDTCFINGRVKHEHERSQFGVSLGGNFFEINFEVNSIVPGHELQFGMTDRTASAMLDGATLRCNDTGVLFNDKAVAGEGPLRCNDVVTIRLQSIGASNQIRSFLSFFVNDTLVGHVVNFQKSDSPHRMGVRLAHSGQAVTVLAPRKRPVIGEAVVLTKNEALLDVEAMLCGLEAPDTELLGQHAKVVSIDESDSTAELLFDNGDASWFPRTAFICPEPQQTKRDIKLPAPQIGMKVQRNVNHWIWGNQDGKAPFDKVLGAFQGVVTDSLEVNEWIRVKWDKPPSTGKPIVTNSYRYGADERWDVLAVPCVGSIVTRNDLYWKWGREDGDGKGLVYHSEGDLVRVKWENGFRGVYRFGWNGAYDVAVVEPPSDSTKAELAALVNDAAHESNGLLPQTVQRIRSGDSASSEAESEISTADFTGTWSLLDRVRSVDIDSGETDRLAVFTSGSPCTVVTREVFPAPPPSKVTCHCSIIKNEGEEIRFGVCIAPAEKTHVCALGSSEIPASIAVVCADAMCSVMVCDVVLHPPTPIANPLKTVLRFDVEGNTIRFFVNDDQIGDGFALPVEGAAWRVGMSLRAPGQLCFLGTDVPSIDDLGQFLQWVSEMHEEGSEETSESWGTEEEGADRISATSSESIDGSNASGSGDGEGEMPPEVLHALFQALGIDPSQMSPEQLQGLMQGDAGADHLMAGLQEGGHGGGRGHGRGRGRGGRGRGGGQRGRGAAPASRVEEIATDEESDEWATESD